MECARSCRECGAVHQRRHLRTRDPATPRPRDLASTTTTFDTLKREPDHPKQVELEPFPYANFPQAQAAWQDELFNRAARDAAAEARELQRGIDRDVENVADQLSGIRPREAG